MKLDDINKQINSDVINNLLEDKFGVKINFDSLTKAQLSKLRESIAKAHAKTVKSMPFNSGHRNPEYLEQIALLEAIELRINEVEKVDEIFGFGKKDFRSERVDYHNKMAKDHDNRADLYSVNKKVSSAHANAAQAHNAAATTYQKDRKSTRLNSSHT